MNEFSTTRYSDLESISVESKILFIEIKQYKDFMIEYMMNNTEMSLYLKLSPFV